MREIAGSTVKSAEALDKDEIAKFCGILTIDMTQSSVLQVWRAYVVEGVRMVKGIIEPR